MKTRAMTGPVRRAGAMCAALMATLLAAPAAAAERPTDKDVKQLIARINHERGRFENQLDGKSKRSIIRGSGGKVDVERYLDDLQDNVNKPKERFTSQYAASAEATAELRQDADIRHSMVTVPPDRQSGTGIRPAGALP